MIFLNSMFVLNGHGLSMEKFYCSKVKTFTVKSEGHMEVTESSVDSEVEISALYDYFKQQKADYQADYLVAYSDSNAIYTDGEHWYKFEFFKDLNEGDILLPSGEIINNSNPSLDDGLHVKFSSDLIDSNINVAVIKFTRYKIWETTSVIVKNSRGRWLLLTNLK